ncbi:MAG: hypothetical protein QHH07_00655 [Sedimentisphaerales bacterium]|nr:hypothetical protein [Sedimentisphaerales bacterium]
MDVIKWIRKNDRKLMAIVVIVILFGFIGGGELLQLLARGNRPVSIGTFGAGQKVTNADLMDARSELELLARLGVPQFLRSQIRTSPPNLYGALLSELLFAERRPDPVLANYLAQVAMSDQYRITPRDLASVYKKDHPAALYWLLLTSEARQAGIAVPLSRAANLLARILPSTTGAEYGQVMQHLISAGHPERQVLETFAKLMAVLQYCHVVCSMGDLTNQQVDHLVCWDRESIDFNAVVLDAEAFVGHVDGNLPDPQLHAQLEKYKDLYAGQVNSDNPFGFGYKIPARVQLEYMLLRVDQIAATIPKPTRQQAEDYYHRNLEQMFTRSLPEDPNDPNSPTKQIPIPFAEVADQIEANWVAEKAREKARAILTEARNMAEVGLSEQDQTKVDIEQLKSKAPAYGPIAQQLSQRYGFQIVAGQSGLLTLQDLVQRDPHLGMLTISGRAQWPLPLAQLLFTADPIDQEDLATVGIQRPVLFESLGPAQEQRGPYTTGEVMAIVRLTEARGPEEPNDVGLVYDNTPSSLDPNHPRQHFSLRQRLQNDLVRMRAYELATRKAKELAGLVQGHGWEDGLRIFNQQVRVLLGLDPNGPEVFSLRPQRQQRMIFTGEVQQYLKRAMEEPMAMQTYRNMKAQKILMDRLYGLVDPDANTPANLPAVVESQASMKVYCIKDLAIRRFDLEEYAKVKGMYAYQEDFIQTQTLAVTHLDPTNMLRRMRFQPASENR